MSDIDDAIATLTHIRDDAAYRIAALRASSSPMPGSFCVHCGDMVNGVNGTEECPVSRYMSRLGTKGILDARKGEIHGQGHLWSSGHVEDWFNYSGPRGAERGW
jgi:hypothetical protein